MNGLLILILVGYFLVCIGIGGWSESKGRGFAVGFLISLFLSPVVGLVVVALFTENRSVVDNRLLASGELKKCPKCAELIKSEAIKCRYCGNEDFPNEHEYVCGKCGANVIYGQTRCTKCGETLEYSK